MFPKNGSHIAPLSPNLNGLFFPQGGHCGEVQLYSKGPVNCSVVSSQNLTILVC